MKENRTILQIIATLAPAGAELLLLNICKGLMEYRPGKYKFKVLALIEKGILEERFKSTDIPVEIIPRPKANGFSRCFQVMRVIRQFSPDIVHTHLLPSDKFGLSAALFCGIKNRISTIHNCEPDRSLKDTLWDEVIARMATRFISVSQSAKSLWVSRHFPESRIHVIPNAPAFQAAKNVRSKDHPGKGHILKLVNVARINPQKGQLFLVRAMKYLLDSGFQVTLDIYGIGEEKDVVMIKNEIELLHLSSSVYLKGRTDTLADLLPDYDIMVSSSLYEGMPLACIEGMGAGLPIVCTDIRPHREIFGYCPDDIFAQASDPISLSNAISRVATDQSLYNRLSRANFENARLFSKESMIQRYDQFYDSLIDPCVQ
ncbi:MAG: hypothetical protein A2293_07805 [Elusimicrobia bacterium RIFOXYB2_FULL_49_7]|nr:MAG: hypothetical protein A2293_07805 [Elusimicrobia bacterium RIFOXYB2_FULL_49_7]